MPGAAKEFWEHIAAEIRRELTGDHFTQAVVGAVREVGAALSRYFPTEKDDRDELSNEVGGD